MKKQSGFTLIELIITMAIILIISLIAIPNFIGWLPNFRLKGDAHNMLSNFQRAKIAAIKQNTNCAVTFNQVVGAVTYDYIVYIDADNDVEYDAGEQVIEAVKLNVGIQFDTAYNTDGISFVDDTMAFRPNGFPRSKGGAAGNGTVSFKNTKGKSLSVVVSRSGNIRIRDNS